MSYGVRLMRIAAVIVTVLSVVLVTRLKLSTDLTELFPKTVEAETLARVTHVFGGGDVAPVLVRGDDAAEVERAAHEAATALRACGSIAQVIEEMPAPAPKIGEAPDPTAAWRFAGPIARDELARAVTARGHEEAPARHASAAPRAGRRRRRRQARARSAAPHDDPLGGARRDRRRRARERRWRVRREGRARAPPRHRAARARLRLGAAARFTSEAEGAIDGVRRAHPNVVLALTGGHVIAKQTEAMMKGDLQKSGILSGVLASLVFLATFRRPRALLAVLPPLAAGTLWTTALAALIYPRLSAIATAFAAVVVGVGVDTGVHVYGRLLAARREGHSPSEAAAIARSETWKPTLGAAVAAGAAFACLGLSDIAGMRQLGVLCAFGEVLTAVAILLVVPEVGAWLERGPPPRELRLPFVAALTATRPRALVVLAAAAGAIALALAFGAPTIDHGVVALDARVLPAAGVYDEIYATFGGTRGQLLVVSADPDEARARARSDAVAEVAEKLAADE